MKRIISLIIAVLLCIGLASPVYAAVTPFVPSIGYKDGPDIDKADPHGNCLVLTTITQAKNKSTDIYQEDRDLLLDVYKQLSDGTMKTPADKNYVIRDLVDLSWKKTSCVEADHGHKEWLEEDNTSITVTFDLGVKKGVDVVVMTYVDGKWVEAKSVKNNGNGTVTVEFEDICPVAFCVKRSDAYNPPKTGDAMGQKLNLYIALMAVSVVGLVTLVILRHKKRK